MATNNPAEELLGDLMSETIKLLLQRIREGSASPADLSVARAMLRDNNITASTQPGSQLHNMMIALPTLDEAIQQPSKPLAN